MKKHRQYENSPILPPFEQRKHNNNKKKNIKQSKIKILCQIPPFESQKING
ncbi:hypothetical protein DOY81_004744 [Sarcophaga bullata]|nr:hypothetical protein DOY81_004744 [Sarcophaga bullata]